MADRALVLRRYRPEDMEETVRLWLASWRSTGLEVAQLAQLPELLLRFPQEIADGWDVHIAARNGKIVGFLALGQDGYLSQLFVAPGAQGGGVGKALLDLAKQLSPAALRLTTASDNQRARRFYEREGFRAGETSLHTKLGHPIITYHWSP